MRSLCFDVLSLPDRTPKSCHALFLGSIFVEQKTGSVMMGAIGRAMMMGAIGRAMSTRCETCAYTQVHNHLPRGVSVHCEKCHDSLTGLSECHCGLCCRSFGGDVAFALHRGPGGECRDLHHLTRRGGENRFKLEKRSGASVWVQKRAGGVYRRPV